jgi:DNA polymerase-4
MVVDSHLPFVDRDPRPLRVVFLDLNAYFASVEQAERPELRGRPIAVAPVTSDGGTVIAASYEAKAFGVRTGTLVGDAKRMCPEITIVDGRHSLYTHYHERVKQAAETVLPIEKVKSIDEMSFRLIGAEREPANAMALAQRLKAAIREQVAETMTCSVGVAPNEFLAKLGTDMMKPDGLVMIQAHELPDRLRGMDVKTFCGINRRMAARLGSAGIFDSDGMIAATREELRKAFGSLVGERWWYLLRGFELNEEPIHRRTLGHSHVLPPERRTDQGAKDVMLRLIQKATARLRDEGLWATEMHVRVGARQQGWKVSTKLPPLQDTVSVVQRFNELWSGREIKGAPTSAAVTFCGLHPAGEVTPSLFDETLRSAEASKAVDSLNKRMGKNSILLASGIRGKDTAPERIAFTKTSLFSEGKGDNEWDPSGAR